MKRFAAEVLFPNPKDVPGAQAALAAVNCKCEVDLDAIDLDSSTVFTTISGSTTIADERELANWLINIISPYDGDIVEWSFGEPWKIRD
jgi:hypothetical protein